MGQNQYLFLIYLTSTPNKTLIQKSGGGGWIWHRSEPSLLLLLFYFSFSLSGYKVKSPILLLSLFFFLFFWITKSYLISFSFNVFWLSSFFFIFSNQFWPKIVNISQNRYCRANGLLKVWFLVVLSEFETLLLSIDY